MPATDEELLQSLPPGARQALAVWGRVLEKHLAGKGRQQQEREGKEEGQPAKPALNGTDT